MILFDSVTQRRSEQLSEAEILPAAEVLPQFAPGGYAGLLEGMDGLIAQVKKANPVQVLKPAAKTAPRVYYVATEKLEVLYGK